MFHKETRYKLRNAVPEELRWEVFFITEVMFHKETRYKLRNAVPEELKWDVFFHNRGNVPKVNSVRRTVPQDISWEMLFQKELRWEVFFHNRGEVPQGNLYRRTCFTSYKLRNAVPEEFFTTYQLKNHVQKRDQAAWRSWSRKISISFCSRRINFERYFSSRIYNFRTVLCAWRIILLQSVEMNCSAKISKEESYQKQNSWTYSFFEVSGHNLKSFPTWVFRIQCLHYKPVSPHFCSRSWEEQNPLVEVTVE